MLFVFVCVYWWSTHMYPILPVSIDCPFLNALRYSLTFI